MKKIYFVRHGQSEGNVGSIRQNRNSALTEHGRRQAESIASRVSGLGIEVVVSSVMSRALETGDIIARHLDVPLQISELFIERRRPSEQLEKSKDDPIAISAEKMVRQNFTVPDYRYSDEENFEDLKDRAGQILNFLMVRPEENILVSTHGFIMRIVLARAVFGPDLTAEQCDNFIRVFHMENTGISVFGCDETKDDNPWWVWTWNDHAHLREIKD